MTVDYLQFTSKKNQSKIDIQFSEILFCKKANKFTNVAWFMTIVINKVPKNICKQQLFLFGPVKMSK